MPSKQYPARFISCTCCRERETDREWCHGMWVTGRACGAAASVPTRAAVHTRHALLHASDPVTDGWTDLLGILAARAWQWQGAQPHQAAMIEERILGSSPARAPDGLVRGHACARAGRQVVDGSQHHRIIDGTLQRRRHILGPLWLGSLCGSSSTGSRLLWENSSLLFRRSFWRSTPFGPHAAPPTGRP
jgi:hypothetical protein